MYDVDELLVGIQNNERKSLARAITLIESKLPAHNNLANELLCKILAYRAAHPHVQRDYKQWKIDEEYLKSKQVLTFDETQQQNLDYPNLKHRHRALPEILKYRKGKPRGPLRIGVSGTPGVGKSTFLEHFGMHLIEKYGLKVAVLSIDPSSLITGGSLLGDKTRMQRLALDPNAYIRPSPSKGILGGIATNTSEVITLCEHAGYDIVFVETVGVGQSEHHVVQVCDMLLNLMNVSGGDELQGIKKGMMEVVDIVAITKADGDLYNAACRTKADYSTAMQMYTTRSYSYGWTPKVLLSSIKEDKERYMDSIWGAILQYEHCLLQPISNLSANTLSSLNFVVDRAPAIEHAEHAHQQGLSQKNRNMLETSVDVITMKAKGASTSASSADESSNGSSSDGEDGVKSHDRTLLDVKRANQRVQWMWSQISQTMMGQFQEFVKNDKDSLPSIQLDLISDMVTPRIAAKQSFDAYIKHTIDVAMKKQVD
jgi:LAO/AO transport system kinase